MPPKDSRPASTPGEAHKRVLGALASEEVFETEPLPEDSPLWDMPNVLVSPHSARTSDRENGRITDLFCENLRRWLAADPLRNMLNAGLMY